MDRALLAGRGKLVSTDAAAGVVHLPGLAVAAKPLELAVHGGIVLIQAYVRVVDIIDRVFAFQPASVSILQASVAMQNDSVNGLQYVP